jgi:hypothetical protein
MFFNKKIKGKVVECSIRNEYTLSQAYMEYHREREYDYEYNYFYDLSNAYCHYVEYQLLVVEFVFLKKKRVEKFTDVTLNSHYDVFDSILIVFNRFNKSFRIKD